MRRSFVVLVSLLALPSARPQSPLGFFETQTDVGNVHNPGSTEYDQRTGTYTVSGGGENMWSGIDQFHFVWKRVSAQDLTLAANISILSGFGDGHRKGVLMIRQDLDTDSAYVDAASHGDGLTSLQFRRRKGEATSEVESNVSGPGRLRIEKHGDRFYLWIGSTNNDLQFSGASARVEIRAPFYVGIGVCAHRREETIKAAFTDVELTPSVPHDKATYSAVETVLLSADARVGYVSREHLAFPGWTADGHALTYEIAGNLEQVSFTPLKTAAPVGEAVTDASGPRFMYFASGQNGTQQIWRRFVDGVAPAQVTSDEFNNVEPRLSPDGQYLLFLSYSGTLKAIPENGELILRIMSLADKSIKSLAAFIGGPQSIGALPWSPDGRRVAFISYQSLE